MRDSQISQRNNALLGSSHSEPRTSELLPTNDDAGLLALEAQFNSLIAEVVAAQKTSDELATWPDRLAARNGSQEEAKGETDKEAWTKRVEAALARLCPIEQAIMATPARTIVGLGVKARHAAYVMSHYWEAPIDRIDWDAQAVRLLVEAVCDLARSPLPIRDVRGDE